MAQEKHNGWTNYATWRINLEIFDNVDFEYWKDYIENTRGESHAYDLGQHLETYVDEKLVCECDNNLVTDYAQAFVNDVNWRQIAQHIIDDYYDNYCCNYCNEPLEYDKDKFCSDKCEKEDELLATHPKG
jgi:hypothetical protein